MQKIKENENKQKEIRFLLKVDIIFEKGIFKELTAAH